ncbi:MAG: DNA cytosine methyltransferase [Thermoguttaceae bacterium]|jgi:DNA (cytosine-5)-methyltransferase 1
MTVMPTPSQFKLSQPKRSRTLRTVDLFAGCGGLSLGFQNEGFDVVAAFDSWDAAANCYRLNFNHPIFQTDLSDFDLALKAIKPFQPEVVVGGPPCQDFSHAGKRIEDARANLTNSFAMLVAALQPTCFVMENVDRARKSATYVKARKIFKKAGYGLTEVVLDASLCGTPQKRRRFICFGMLGKKDKFALELIESNLASKPTTLREYFGDALDFEFYYRHPRNYSRRAVFSIDEPAPTMRGVNRPVPDGYKGHPSDACPVSKSLHVLTFRERSLIQTFPENFQWVGNKTEIEQMIGNAVPVNLARFVARCVKATLGEKSGD